MNEVDHYILEQELIYQELLSSLRNFILNLAPQVQETIKWQIPFFSYYGLLCYLNVKAKEKKIYLGFYKGIELSNAQALLVGEGKQVKHVIFNPEDKIPEESLFELFQEAMLLNEKIWETKKK